MGRGTACAVLEIATWPPFIGAANNGSGIVRRHAMRHGFGLLLKMPAEPSIIAEARPSEGSEGVMF